MTPQLIKTTGQLDGVMSWQEAKQYLKQEGWEAFLCFLSYQYPNQDLYQFSAGWEDSPKYILKACGKFGDIIIGWSENNYATGKSNVLQ